MTTESTNLISQLRATLGKMEIALGAIDEAIVWTDEKGTIQWCNNSFNLLVGLTHLEILGARLFELLPIEHQGQGLLPEQHPLVRALKGPDKIHGTYEFSKGASRSILEITAAGIQLNEQDKTVVLAIHDITERKQTEEKLARSHESLELRVAERTEALSRQQEILAEGQSLAKFGTVQRDLQTGEGWWSDEVFNIFGIVPQKHPPTPEAFLEHVHPDDREYMKEMIAEARKTGNTAGEFRVIRSSGEELTIYGQAKIHNDEAGDPIWMISTLLDITERKQAEMKILEAQKQSRSLSRRLITVQETERRRIALELHDQLGQDLALLSIEIEQLIQKAPESQAKQLQKLTAKTRKVSSQPSSLEHLGLVAAANSLCKEVSQASDIQIDFSHSDVPSPIPQDVSICLYRVLQESLTNIVKHSEVKVAQVELAGSPDKLHLRVCDSGVGFSPESVGNGGGLGFVSMRERLSLVGGELLIESQPSVGTQIEVCVPLNSSASPD